MTNEAVGEFLDMAGLDSEPLKTEIMAKTARLASVRTEYDALIVKLDSLKKST